MLRSLALAVFIASSTSLATAADKLKVVASFSILADMAQQVGGERVDVAMLVGADSDAHGFQPSPQHIKKLAEADVLVFNGLGFEGWMERLIEASQFGKTRVVATNGIAPLAFSAEHDHDHDATEAGDPHAWQDAKLAQAYVANIARGLCDAAPQDCSGFEANAKRYSSELTSLDNDLRQKFETIPAADRIVITSHDAFGYLGKAYGIKFLAAESVEGSASAKKVAKLIRQIRETKAKALFVENIANPKVIDQIARETKLENGGTLYSDALSEKSGAAPTYIEMMRYNAETLTAALRAGRS